MQAFSKHQIEEYTRINASLETSVCSCVWNDKDRIGAVGHLPRHFRVGCSEKCLYAEDRITIRAEHIFEVHQELLFLLHLPLYGLAIREKRNWRLGIFEHQSKLEDMKGRFFVQTPVDWFLDRNKDYFALFSIGHLHFESLFCGARAVPVWTELESARKYVRSLHFLSRFLLRVKCLSFKELKHLAQDDGQNYLVVNHDCEAREAIIIEKYLNIFDNTLQL